MPLRQRMGVLWSYTIRRQEKLQDSIELRCSHYGTPNDLFFVCCNQWHPCLRCHREVCDKGLEEGLNVSECASYIEEETRPVTMRCTACQLEQPVAARCLGCDNSPHYYCSGCYIWDNTMRDIFHCEACGICRVGHRSRVFHCDGCGTCLDKVMQNKHRCLKDGMKADCAICLDPLFQSKTPTCQLPRCGHSFHQKCLREWTSYSHNMLCPMCKRALVAWASQAS
eukprot:Protomagalhaensia_sp_Gyna_25__5500@NODE_733_length_2736_cov_53_536522_g572_i0_p1_GENE_NODE_733_length_2736_cov_53_536522_g572_i0NODE_733_length_2736_cov_53_536522_g572_i0_p1_ORF_typecomplete_len225_score7_48zfRING_2/PF13639_6/2_3e11zfCHY/PF05495_12/1_5e09zfC3HC4/PF00097_25/3_7e03zfC3HC4/PF00097_25/8e03zfC3HC4/PF00097_25/1_6e02zfC3HC4/PF00097_25/5e02zfC3HC4/PF00097_25/2_4e08zfC3HC4_2/PF13923_6/74zfC3HC4_2/PF13923_6/7_6e08zfRING_UBOX/PF13445_6/4_2e03zfRING_UBOX/PF13445_6/1_8e03zfRING_UBOX/PF13445_